MVYPLVDYLDPRATLRDEKLVLSGHGEYGCAATGDSQGVGRQFDQTQVD